MSSRLGMNQTLASQTTASGSLRKRPAARGAPKRSGDCWDSVSIVSEHERHDAAGAVQLLLQDLRRRRHAHSSDHLCNTCTGESEEFISSRLRRQERLLAQCDTFEVKKAKRSESDDDATDEEDH